MAEKVATLGEINSAWTLDDIARMNAILDYRTDARVEAERKARRK